jgi:hypothetical protein
MALTAAQQADKEAFQAAIDRCRLSVAVPIIEKHKADTSFVKELFELKGKLDTTVMHDAATSMDPDYLRTLIGIAEEIDAKGIFEAQNKSRLTPLAIAHASYSRRSNETNRTAFELLRDSSPENVVEAAELHARTVQTRTKARGARQAMARVRAAEGGAARAGAQANAEVAAARVSATDARLSALGRFSRATQARAQTATVPAGAPVTTGPMGSGSR